MAPKKRNPDGEHAFKARFPIEVWDAVEEAADEDGRSINAEIVWMIRQQLAARRTEDTDQRR
jgi:hypothetical protein